MATDKPGGWKHNTGANIPKPAATGPVASRKSWQPGATAPKSTMKTKSRTGRFLLVGGLVALLIAAAVVVIPWLKPPKYPALIVVAPSAPDNLAWPETVAGANVGDDFQSWKTEHPSGMQLVANREKTAAPGAWKQALDPKAESIVLYFAALVGVDSNGPFVWEIDPAASAPTESHKLYVRDVLKTLEGHPGSQPKLIVFDPPDAPVSWTHGGIVHDFPRALKELEAEIAKIDGLAILCSHDVDQRAWTSETSGRTVFGQAFLDGVRGAAGGSDGSAITGATLMPYLKQEVEKWAIVNRDEKQTPILLPGDGADRAAKVTLASKPNGDFAAKPIPTATPTPAALGEAWSVAEALANRTPSPDTTDPARWKEYLELLLRWERLVRLPGTNTATIAAKVKVLGDQLRSATVTVVHLPTALPAGAAFGHIPPALPKEELEPIWSAATANARTEVWLGSRGKPTDTAQRMAWTAAALDKLYDVGPSAKNLKIADEILKLIDGDLDGRAVEGHFVRMLNQHLETAEGKRPGVELLTRAIRLRRSAEETAWIGDPKSGVDPHAEQVQRRTRAIIDWADEYRRLGEDCLFVGDAKSWVDAESDFAKADEGYAVARRTAKVVATALQFRDRAFARLPFYARWLGEYRGTLSTKDVDVLIVSFESAAKSAHAIGALEAAAESPLADFDREGREGAKAYEAVALAHLDEAKRLNNVVQPSNWHSLDGALCVPFLPAEIRAQRLANVRSVSAGLAPNPNQATGVQAPALPARDRSERRGRMALAYLGDDIAASKQRLLQPKEGAWWESHRLVGEFIGKRFLSYRASAKSELEKAQTGTLADGIPHWASAAKSARLASAAAPLDPKDNPLLAEQNYWRHDFLIWQSRRITDDGWADVGVQTPDQWFCRKAKKLLLTEARQLAGATAPGLSPQELQRRGAACAAGDAYEPVELAVDAMRERVVADESTWDANLTIQPTPGRKIGFPNYSLGLPGAPYHRPNDELIGRKRVDEFALRGAAKFVRTFEFQSLPRIDGPSAEGKLRGDVFYRGHIYRTETKVVLAGAPSLEWNYTPPSGKAAFAILADKDLVTGAVTLLLDITNSMDTFIDNTKVERITEAKKAFNILLRQIPVGTMVSIATFYGLGDAIKVDEVCAPFKITGDVNVIDKKMELVNAVKLASDKADTPLAGGIREVLHAERGKKFWPEQFSGTRTLIVLTDGEDNWGGKDAYNGKTPAQVMIGALKATKDDVEAHVVFFGIESADGKIAYEQFKSVQLVEQFRDPPRTPAKLYKDIKSGASFAAELKAAVLPRVNYLNTKIQGRHEVTLPGENIYRTSPALDRGVYSLFGLGAAQKLELFDGDRVLLRARAHENNLALSMPAAVYDLPSSPDYGRLVRSPAGGLHLSVPKFAFGRETASGRDLSLLATLEPRPNPKTQELLQAPRPLFAWFDIAYADGKPPNPMQSPRVRIANRPGTISPTWTVDMFDWDRNRGGAETIRKPAIDAYWLEGKPPVLTTYSVDMKNLSQSKANLRKSASDRGETVELVDLAIETEGPNKFLAVRLRYSKPGEYVFLRPGGWQDKDAKLVKLREQHAYFDAHARYTARFGPLSPEDFDSTQLLELFSVAALRDHARKAELGAKLTFPERPLEAYDFSHKITLSELKKE